MPERWPRPIATITSMSSRISTVRRGSERQPWKLALADVFSSSTQAAGGRSRFLSLRTSACATGRAVTSQAPRTAPSPDDRRALHLSSPANRVTKAAMRGILAPPVGALSATDPYAMPSRSSGPDEASEAIDRMSTTAQQHSPRLLPGDAGRGHHGLGRRGRGGARRDGRRRRRRGRGRTRSRLRRRRASAPMAVTRRRVRVVTSSPPQMVARARRAPLPHSTSSERAHHHLHRDADARRHARTQRARTRGLVARSGLCSSAPRTASAGRAIGRPSRPGRYPRLCHILLTSAWCSIYFTSMWW